MGNLTSHISHISHISPVGLLSVEIYGTVFSSAAKGRLNWASSASWLMDDRTFGNKIVHHLGKTRMKPVAMWSCMSLRIFEILRWPFSKNQNHRVLRICTATAASEQECHTTGLEFLVFGGSSWQIEAQLPNMASFVPLLRCSNAKHWKYDDLWNHQNRSKSLQTSRWLLESSTLSMLVTWENKQLGQITSEIVQCKRTKQQVQK